MSTRGPDRCTSCARPGTCSSVTCACSSSRLGISASGGVSGVLTYPQFRGQGHASALMRRAAAHIEEKRLDLGMLFCDKETEPFYNALGWQALEPGRVVVKDDGGRTGGPGHDPRRPRRPAGGPGARMELVMDLPDEAAELFRVPPEDFIAERDALVQRLRAEGRDEDATAVKALRKPTTVVWALNQLAAREPDALAALFEAGRDLRAAQQAALAGKPSGAEDLRITTAARRDAVGAGPRCGGRDPGCMPVIEAPARPTRSRRRWRRHRPTRRRVRRSRREPSRRRRRRPRPRFRGAADDDRASRRRRRKRDAPAPTRPVDERNARRRGPVPATAGPPRTGSRDSWPTRASG